MIVLWLALAFIAGAWTRHKYGGFILKRIFHLKPEPFADVVRGLSHDAFTKVANAVDEERERRCA